MTSLQSTACFRERVVDDVRYRPDYPPALLEWLVRAIGVARQWPVTDFGAATGISSRMSLEGGYHVIAVEPNESMLTAAELWLGNYDGFSALDGRADATGLPDVSVDLVMAAPAFLWFDEELTRREFTRILRPEGFAAISWNFIRRAGMAFLQGYDSLRQTYGTDGDPVADRYAGDARMALSLAPVIRAACALTTRSSWTSMRCKGA